MAGVGHRYHWAIVAHKIVRKMMFQHDFYFVYYHSSSITIESKSTLKIRIIVTVRHLEVTKYSYNNSTVDMNWHFTKDADFHETYENMQLCHIPIILSFKLITL